MNLAQLIVVCLASASVARAYISLGLMSFRLKWVNYVIALTAGVVGAWIGLTTPAFRSIALVVSVLFAVVALAIYHGLRWYFVFAKMQERRDTANVEVKQNVLTVERKTQKTRELEESYASLI